MPIGEALLALAKITPEQLSEALHRQSLTRGVPLGQVLLDMGLVTTADLQLALADVQLYKALGGGYAPAPRPLASRTSP